MRTYVYPPPALQWSVPLTVLEYKSCESFYKSGTGRFPLISRHRLNKTVAFYGSRPVHRPTEFDNHDRIKTNVPAC